ncbi:MAG: hypothetical protein ACE10C_11090 [Candidatus Binatia bacterium]
MHRATDRFWRCFNTLPEAVQDVAKKNFDLLRHNPSHPSLHFKKVENFWSVRAGLRHRALAVEDGKDFIWVWIGTHDDYQRMLK